MSTPASPQRRTHKVRTTILSLLGAIIGIIVVVSVANSGTHASVAKTPPSTSAGTGNHPAPAAPPSGWETETPAPIVPEKETYGLSVGTTVNLTDDAEGSAWDLTVNSVKTYHPGEYDESAGDGYHYVVANVTYKATSGTVSPNPWDWKSKANDGQTRDVKYLGNDTMLKSDDLDSGQKTTGDVFFKIKDGTTGNTIVYSPGLSEMASWAVPVSA